MKHSSLTKIISVTLGVLFLAGIAFAGTVALPGTHIAPTGTAPANNTDIPVNVTNILQAKTGGLGVSTFNAVGAASLKGKVYVQQIVKAKTLPNGTVINEDLHFGDSGSVVGITATGDLTAWKLQAEGNLKNNSMKHVCADPKGLLVLCDPGTPPVNDICPNIEGVQTSLMSPITQTDSNGNCVGPTVPVNAKDLCLNVPGVQPAVPPGMYSPVNSKICGYNYAFANRIDMGSIKSTFAEAGSFWDDTPFGAHKIYRYSAGLTVNFGAATKKDLSFRWGWCTALTTTSRFCINVPKAFTQYGDLPTVSAVHQSTIAENLSQVSADNLARVVKLPAGSMGFNSMNFSDVYPDSPTCGFDSDGFLSFRNDHLACRYGTGMYVPDANQSGIVTDIYIWSLSDPEGYIQAVKQFPGTGVPIHVCTGGAGTCS